jgi:predicted NBD/HSP70 family sugar kinase
MKTADPELMRAINRFHVMDAIRRFGPISRVEISERTELSPTTVSAITAALLDDRLIVPRQVVPVEQSDAGRGRPRIMLELNPDAAFVVGAKLARDQITVAVTNFRAELITLRTLPVRVDRQPVPVIADLVEDGVRRCIADAGLAVAQIGGLCVGLPGLIERGSGVCRQSPLFRERDVRFGAAIEARLAIPTTVDSDANLVTLAEHWFGHGRGLDDFLVVSVEHTLGLGIVHNGELFRGANSLCPDLGDLLVWPSAPGANGTAPPQRLSLVASAAAMLAAAGDCSTGFTNDGGFEDGRGLDRAIALARSGQPCFVALFRRAGEALGYAIANLITLFAPPKVILAGAALRAGALFVEPLTATVRAVLPEALASVGEIVVHEWGDEFWARGAAALTLRDLYGAPWNTTGPAKLL